MFTAFPFCRSFNHFIILKNFHFRTVHSRRLSALDSTQFPYSRMQLQNKRQISKRIYLFYSSSNESCLRSRIFAFFDFFLDLKPSVSPSFFGIIFWFSLASAVISSSSFQLCSRWLSSILFSDDFAGSSVAKNTPVKCAISYQSELTIWTCFWNPWFCHSNNVFIQ